jgi:L-lactate utilization protein LutC
MTAREQIFNSIRQNLAVSRRFDSVHAEHHQGETRNSSIDAKRVADRDAVVDEFCENAGALGVQVEIVDAADVGTKIRSIIDLVGANKIAVSNSALVSGSIASVEGADFVRNASTDFLFDSDLGITSAQWAIAETGTLVLEAESEDHRLISLVPPVHLCLLEASKIRQTLGEILELTQANLGHAMTFITGASRTSDIELTLAIGVHGPGELHIIVLNDR